MENVCLLAAHDPWLIQLFRIYAEEGGFTVVQAFESQDVLPLALSRKPEFILLQMDLAGTLKGLELLDAIRAHPMLARVVVLILAWQGNPEEILRQDTFLLQEPVTYDAFMEILSRAGITSKSTPLPSGDSPENPISGGNKGKKEKKTTRQH